MTKLGEGRCRVCGEQGPVYVNLPRRIPRNVVAIVLHNGSEFCLKCYKAEYGWDYRQRPEVLRRGRR